MPASRHPSGPSSGYFAGARVAGLGVVLLILLLVGGGLLITHVFAHSVGRWDEHVNALFAEHRTPTGNRITGDFTLLANAPAIIGAAAVVSATAAARHPARLAALLMAGLVIELAGFLASSYVVGRREPGEPTFRIPPAWGGGRSCC